MYVYLFYPALVFLFGKILNRRHFRSSESYPVVSVVIAAYNEKENIRETILNKLAQTYPEDKLEVIVISDGSDDGTDDIVTKLGKPNVRLLRQEPRQGKTSALNMGIAEAKGEIIVFSDSNSIYSPDAIEKLVSNFSDSSVGYVTGKMVYVNGDGTMVGDGCSTYMKYENFLRENESLIGSVVGVDGGVDAVRKSLYVPMGADNLPDFILPLKIVEKGYRVVYDPTAILNEQTLSTSSDEYKMRVRVSLRSLYALYDMRSLLNPFKSGVFSWQLLSHKVLRYGVFIFLILFYISNIFLVSHGDLYSAFFASQTIFYLMALTGYLLEKRGGSVKIFYIPFYFCLLNIASGHAFIKMLKGEKQITWTPRKG